MTYARHKAPTVEMVPNKERILEGILCLLNEAKDRGLRLTQYDIVKSFFLADRSHINKYGRPISFDNYKAMLHGPVPSLVYDLLKNDVKFREIFGDGGPPWVKEPAPKVGKRAFYYDSPARMCDEEELAPSEIRAFKDALSVVLTLGFSQLRKLTHEDPSYVDAWEDISAQDRAFPKKAFPMSYGLFFDVPDYDRARSIAFLSAHH